MGKKVKAVAEVYYLAIAFGYWGRGANEADALKNCRKAGAKKGDKTLIYLNEIPANLSKREAPFVDDWGQTNYYGRLALIAEYSRGKRTERLETQGLAGPEEFTSEAFAAINARSAKAVLPPPPRYLNCGECLHDFAEVVKLDSAGKCPKCGVVYDPAAVIV